MNRINVFPILGGRLLKRSRSWKSSWHGRFPILGGRLLKDTFEYSIAGISDSFQSLEGGY